MSPAWVNQAAVAWVFDEAPVPADLISVLAAIARYAHTADGRGARPVVSTIADNVGKSVEQVRKDIAKLRGFGLLVLGDQSLVGHLPAGRRPVVYDLPLHVKGPKPSKASRNKSGKKAEVDEFTPSLEATGSSGATPSLEARSTPSTEATSTPSSQARQKKTLNKTFENSLSARTDDGVATAGALQEERDDAARSEDQNLTLPQRLLTEHGVTNRAAADRLIAAIVARHKVAGDGWWIAADKNGTLAARIVDASSASTTAPTADSRAAFARAIANNPPCEHSIPGGHDIHEPTGWSACSTHRVTRGWKGAGS